MEFTGERFHPECLREIWYEHYHRYVMASSMVQGKKVLDLACGEGYGSAILAESAASVLGVDISSEAIGHARARYSRDNLSFQEASATAIPLADDTIDVVVSFETLEHLTEQEAMLTEFRRVLKADGVLIISSPDRKAYSDDRDYENEYHVAELYRDEFDRLLARFFPASRVLGQKLLFASLIWDPARAEHHAIGQSLARDQTRPERIGSVLKPLYWIAIAAANPTIVEQTVRADFSIFTDHDESVYDHYYHEIRKNMAAGAIINERDAQIGELQQRIEALEAERIAPWWRRIFRPKNNDNP